MEVKGIAVASIPKFVQHDFESRFKEWIDSLSKESQTIMKGTILMSNWYPMQEAVIEPTSKICDLFYGYQNQGAWDAGRFSADYALKGIYKIFVKFGSPEFLIKRASRIMTTYYRPSKLSVPETSSGKAKVHISEFTEPNQFVELRIAGWIERALEISGCKEPDVKITYSLTRGDSITEITAKWK